MKKLIIPAVAITMLATGAFSAAHAAPGYSTDSSRILWFLVMSDQHITCRNCDGPERLEWLLNDGIDIVQPELIFNLGDLTDASNGEPLISVYPGQQDEEWQLYREILDESGITVDRYIDLPGNHDQYNEKGLDHYLQYSLAGSTYDRTQHSVVIEKPWGTYHFLGVDTAGNDGAIFPLDNAGLDLNELIFNERALQDNADANLTFAFGHHPVVRPDLGFKLSEGSDEFQALMGDYRVRAYFYGHTHEYRDLYWPDNDLMPVTLQENVDSFGKADENQLLLVAVDNDNMHIRQVSVQEFPWVIVTAPSDVNQGGGNPWAYDVPAGMEQAPIRALAFTSDPFLTCDYRLDNGAWHAMAPVQDHVYQGFMDTRGMQPGNHTVEVRAMPGPSTGHKITFRVTAFPCGNGQDEDSDGLTDYPDDPGCESPADTDEEDPIVIEDVIGPSDAVAETFEEVFEETFFDASPEVFQDVTDQDVAPLEDSIVEDVAIIDAEQDLANGETASPDAGTDNGQVVADARDGGNDESTTSDVAVVDTHDSEDTGTTPVHNDGGCSAGRGANPAPFGLVLLVVAAFLGLRRSRRILN